MNPAAKPPPKEIVRARDQMEKKEKSYIDARSAFRKKVYDYMADGGSPTALANALGVTRGRVYQYRDLWIADQSREEDAG